MTPALQLIALALSVPGAIVAMGELISRCAPARSATHPRVMEIDFSMHVRIGRRP
jgi:hypothetical protein